MTSDKRLLQTLSPQRSQLLSQFLAQQPKPSGVSLGAGVADLGTNLVNAFFKGQGLREETARQEELANILGGQTLEGAVPQGQFGPGAPVQQPATLGSIEQALLASQFPELQQLGAQQRFSTLGREEDLRGTIASERRQEQTQIRKEGRAAKREASKPGAGLAARKLELENRKFDQSVKEFEAKLQRGGLNPEDLFKNEKDLRKEFTGLSKEFIKQRDSFARLQASAQDPSAAGDLALIFNFMKILDPGSVVRESEFATAQNAPAIPERVRAQYNRLLTTGERFTEEARADFTTRGELLFARAQQQHDQRIDTFTGLAERANLDPQNVAIDLQLAEQQATQEGLEQGAEAGGVVDEAAETQQISTPEEAALLPSGTIFIDPSGITRRVP